MEPDTTMGGSDRALPATSLGLVARCSAEAPDEYRAGLDDLCRRYWKPVYWYVRVAWAKSNEDAKDLTQAFFAWLFEGGALRRYAAERGALRTFLKVLLSRFLSHRELYARRLRRGGGAFVLPLHDVPAGGPPSSDATEAFDRAWVVAVLNGAVERVRDRYRAAGRGPQFRVFELYDLAPGDPPTYAEIEFQLGLRPGQARDSLSGVRRAVRAEVRAELSRTTSNERELQKEWLALLLG